MHPKLKLHPILRGLTICLSICSFGYAETGAGDSLQIVFEGDTLRIPRIYEIQFPAYESVSDSFATIIDSEEAYPDENPDDLEASGTISRGIQVSSNASVSLQSSLYLKISGDLGTDYRVDGVLTERTAPLQPIGNTRRLNDFDRVLVNIAGPRLHASIGDIQLKKETEGFGKLQRSIEGIDAEFFSGEASIRSTIGFSYGQYAAQHIQGREGKQGPYRLQGQNGEKFIIILAGSERIELDGELMERGDYIIDYNAAELSFSQDHMISSNSRIMVEYEYVPDIYLANYSFGKQLLSGSFDLGERKSSPFHFSASLSQMKDDSGNPLGDVDQTLLSSVFESLPDTSIFTWLSSIIPDSITGDYHLEAGVLSYVGEGLGTHTASFSYVGLEEGAYRKVIDQGQEYFIQDTLAGEYLPARKLISPQSHSVLSLSSSYNGKYLRLRSDLGVSRKIHNIYARVTDNMDRRAWNGSISLGPQHKRIEVGEKYYDDGFVAFDILAANEFYRRWKISPRRDEREKLDYASAVFGKMQERFIWAEMSQLSRNDSTVGRQGDLSFQTDPAKKFRIEGSSFVRESHGIYDHQHSLKTALRGKIIRSELYGSMEQGLGSKFFQNNDHLSAGMSIYLEPTAQHLISTQIDVRNDYRNAVSGKSIIDDSSLHAWSDQRRDIASAYTFKGRKHLDGKLQFKYRQHENDTTGTRVYALGNLQLNLRALEDRFKYSGHYLLDEEHIPRYDFQYVLVDTGYGDYSFDPVTREYLPVSGGRYIRQRIFSDKEEQVRKVEGKSHLEFSSGEYRNRKVSGYRITLDMNSSQRSQIHTDAILQGQDTYRLSYNYRFDESQMISEVNYNGRLGSRSSALYNFGTEKSRFGTQDLDVGLRWNASNRTRLGALTESRAREVEYNTGAKENWSGIRPYLKHTTTLSQKQQIITDLKYSLIDDKRQNMQYDETYLQVNHRLRVGRRGSIDQKVHVSHIGSDAAGIPYSVFSGRQPGENWKYTFNGRYTFSNRFQLSLNYSAEKRGAGEIEQFMRLEGRTSF